MYFPRGSLYRGVHLHGKLILVFIEGEFIEHCTRCSRRTASYFTTSSVTSRNRCYPCQCSLCDLGGEGICLERRSITSNTSFKQYPHLSFGAGLGLSRQEVLLYVWKYSHDLNEWVQFSSAVQTRLSTSSKGSCLCCNNLVPFRTKSIQKFGGIGQGHDAT